MRKVLLLVALSACSAPAERAKPPVQRPSTTAAAALPSAPGLRLPESVTPLAYDLTLEVDPDRDTFVGDVRVRVRLDKPTDHVWIHADQLTITSARYDGGALTALPVRGDQMVGFGFGKTLAAGELELAFAYTGKTTHDQEGLFRQRTGDRWYLFSQGEAVFARRITPCFDEPRFKTPWRVTLVVPRQLVALANAPELEQQALDGDRKRITFAETRRMPSYLLAIAVGPFDVVDAGTVGKQQIPVRVAVRAGAGKQVEVVASKLPAIVDAVEKYAGEPLPLRKLDLVGVPRFFGAMENPGLITFEERMLVGRASKQRVEYFTLVAAHELAHQWFGNLVTPAWWDDLWLSEAFATWLGEKIKGEVLGAGDAALTAVLDRRDALDADSGPQAMPLRRSIAGNADPDETFDAIAYQKGAAVLATFEALVGAEVFRSALRGYLQAHRDGTARGEDLVTALARVTKPEVGKAFEQYATLAGAPVVDLSLQCDGTPRLVARARDQRLVPACVRYAGNKTPTCALVGDKTELALGATCPAWVQGNAYAGYYYVHWQGRAATQGIAQLAPAARVIVGDDLAAAVHRGDLAAKDALAELRTLLAADVYAQFAALALIRQIDALVDDAIRPSWSAWLVAHMPNLKRLRKGYPGVVVAQELGARLPLPPGEMRKAREFTDKLLAGDNFPDAPTLAQLAGDEGDALFDRIVDKARATKDVDRRATWLQLLGAFPPTFAERTAALATDKSELPIEPIWSALRAQFTRPAARTAAWRALRVHLDTFVKRMPDHIDDIVDAVALLCDRAARDEVAKLLARRPRLDNALTNIDRCIARRAAFGDLAAAIATSK